MYPYMKLLIAKNFWKSYLAVQKTKQHSCPKHLPTLWPSLSPVLTHLPQDKMAAILADDIFKCIFLNENDKILI